MIKYKTKVIFMNKWIAEHPSLSSNEVYKHWKRKAHSYRKQEMLRTYRSVHRKPEPSLIKIARSIPIKYRKKYPKDYRRLRPEEPKPKPEEEEPPMIDEKRYESFYHALDVMVRARRKPKNFQDMRQMMYKSKFSKTYPNKKQSERAWGYLKKQRKLGNI